MTRGSRLPQWPPRLPGAWTWLHWRALVKLALALLTAGVLTTLIFIHLDYYQTGEVQDQFRVDAPLPRDIIAPRTLTWQDEEETKRRRDEAASQVPEAFSYDRDAYSSARADLDRAFALLRLPAPTPDNLESLARLKIPQAIVDATRTFDDDAWDQVEFTTRSVLSEVMSAPIEENRDSRARHQIEARANMRATDPLRIRVISTVANAVLRPTYRVNELRTEELRAKKRAEVRPVELVFHKGEVVLRKGEMLTHAMLAQLKTERLLTPAPLARLLPIAALMLFAVFALGIYLRTFCPQVYPYERKLLLLALLIITPLWAQLTLGQEQANLVGLIAIPAGGMAIAGLLGVPVATVAVMLMSVTAGLTVDYQFPFVLLTLSSALAGIMIISTISSASRAVPGVAALVAINLLLLLSIESVRPGGGFASLWADLGVIALAAGAGGVGATFIAVGAIYILARPFGITTYYRLIELANPHESLLHRMLTEAPGTYHSSVMVANMAEAAADVVGANLLLTRVGALYHDIGKLKRPAFFVENQAPLGIDNVHARLSPKLSHLILVSHVRDGVALARQHKLPDEMIDIIHQHHGTTLAAYFYHRARSEAKDGVVNEHEFRYPGPRPASREAAIVMLADSVQAAVKALKEPTPGRIDGMVQEIISSRLDDGQLIDCDITLRDLHRISAVFTRILTGLYTYSRIEYPGNTKEGARIRAHLHHDTVPATSETTLLTPGG